MPRGNAVNRPCERVIREYLAAGPSSRFAAAAVPPAAVCIFFFCPPVVCNIIRMLESTLIMTTFMTSSLYF